MERVADKVIIIICCIAVLLLIPQTVVFVIGLLLALAMSSLQEVTRIPQPVRSGTLFAYLVAALIFPGFSVFIPLAAYDYLRMRNWLLKLCWVVPLCAALREFDYLILFFILVVALISCSLSWRTERIETERLTYTTLRDELRELSLSLEQKNHDLQEKQDNEVRLATLAERGRIAREIHDNVGHLLTRSVLQIEAASVLHADDAQLTTELGQIGATIHEAFDTVRASVHDLHDESFDLHTQLFAITQNSLLNVNLEYQVEEIPDSVGYGFVAITKEAVANAVKHSDASRVRVLIIEYPAFWQLIIHDNGSKDPLRVMSERDTSVAARITGGVAGGIGLKTMEERARNLGGVFRIDYDKGFRVFVSIPKAS